jgi:hypothetical protein
LRAISLHQITPGIRTLVQRYEVQDRKADVTWVREPIDRRAKDRSTYVLSVRPIFPQRLVRLGDVCLSFCFAQLSPGVPSDITSFRRMCPRDVIWVLVEVLSCWPVSKNVFPSNLSPHTLGIPRVIRLLRPRAPGFDSARPVLGSACAPSPWLPKCSPSLVPRTWSKLN